MTSTLTIEPAHRRKKKLSDNLKFSLRKKNKGCLHEKTFDISDIKYFEALRDMGIEDADIVIDYIEKYEEIILNEEF